MTVQPSGALAPIPFHFHSLVVRTVVDDHGNPWFCAKDICAVLGYTNDSKAIGDHCRKDGVTKRYLTDSLGREQEVSFLNEGNLYRLIIKSRKPAAEPFEQWVMDEVLPTIRKTGSYEHPQYALKDLRSKKAIPGGLTLDQQDAIKALVKARVESLPHDYQGGAAITCWSALKTKFGCTYKAIPPELFSEALSLLARLDLRGTKALPAPEPVAPRYHFPLSDWQPLQRIGNQTWFTYAEHRQLQDRGAQLDKLLAALKQDGHDVSGPQAEYGGMLHLLHILYWQLDTLREMFAKLDRHGLGINLAPSH